MSELVGKTGTMSIASRGDDGPGEVVLAVGAGSATFIAYSTEPIPRGARVVVYDERAARAVDVLRAS